MYVAFYSDIYMFFVALHYITYYNTLKSILVKWPAIHFA